MKIAIFSDWHLGLNFGSDLEMDSFVQLLQAFMQIKEKEIDLIITCGDLFDKTKPSHEVYFEAIKLLNQVDIENKLKLKSRLDRVLKIPMIGIIGNHEYLGKDYKSTVELLEVMDFLRVVHADYITLEKEGEKVSIFGLSGVPDRFAKDIIDKWNPKPIEGSYNILLIHQSIKEYLPFESEEMLSLSNLPEGFDIIANGHLHWSVSEKINEKTLFLMPGSTVSTQNKKIESEKEKGFFIIDTKTNSLDFETIKNTRKVFYLDLDLKKANPVEIKEKIIEELEKRKENFEKKPFLRIRLKGELLDGYFLKDVNLKEIEERYKDLFYLSFANKLQEQRLKESVEKLKSIEQNKGNVFEISKEIFFEQIKQTNISKDFDYQRFFEVLYNKDLEKAKKIILE
jgi:DNA repair protein SbcD/Mre11